MNNLQVYLLDEKSDKIKGKVIKKETGRVSGKFTDR